MLSFIFFIATPPFDTQTDLEAAVVRAASCALGVLQDFCRVPAAPASRTAGCAHVHSRRAQAAGEHVWRRDRDAHVLPAGRNAGRRAGVGRGHSRGQGGAACKHHHGCCTGLHYVDPADPDPRTPADPRYHPIAPLSRAASHHVVRFG